MKEKKKLSKLDITRYIVLGVSFILELFVLVALTSYTLHLKNSDLKFDEERTAVIVTALCLLTTIIGLVMTACKKGGVIISEITMKIGLSCFFLGALMKNEDAPPAEKHTFYVMGFIIVSLVIFVHILLRVSSSGIKKTKVKSDDSGPVLKFTGFDAKEHLEKSEKEYLYQNNKNKEDLIEEDRIRIFDNASVDITYLVTWLIRRGYISKEFQRRIGEETIEKFQNKDVHPALLVRNVMDYQLTRKDISKNLSFFIDSYLAKNIVKTYIYSHKDEARYIFDYYRTVVPKNENGIPNRFSYKFSWETYDKLEAVLDERYAETLLILSEGRSDTSVDQGDIYSNVYGTNINVKAKKKVKDDYIEKCKAHFDEISANLNEEIMDQASKLICETVQLPKEYISKNLKPSSMYIAVPKNEDEIAYEVFSHLQDPEDKFSSVNLHGENVPGVWPQTSIFVKWIIRNGILIGVYPLTEGETPWDIEEDLLYRKYITRQTLSVDKNAPYIKVATNEEAEQLCEKGLLVKDNIITEGFDDLKRTEIYIPTYMKYIKDKYTDMVEALVADGMADYFKIFVEYHNGSVVPDYLRFEARIHDGYDRLVFLEELEY